MEVMEKESRLKELKIQLFSVKKEIKRLQREIEAENEYVKLDFSGTEIMVHESIANEIINMINGLQEMSKLKKTSFEINGNPQNYDNTLMISLNSGELAILIHFDKKSKKIERVRTVSFIEGKISKTYSNVKYKTPMDPQRLLEPIEVANQELKNISKILYC